MILRCYPGQEGKTGTSQVYEDDGVTNGYQHGEYAVTNLSYVRRGEEITIAVAPTQGTFPGQPQSRRCTIELPCTAKLTSCSLTNAQISYDENTLTNRIELSEGPVQSGFSVVIHAPSIDPASLTKRAVSRHLSDLLGQPYETWQAQNSAPPKELEAMFSAAQGLANPDQPDDLDPRVDLARSAIAEASSGDAAAAIDGVIDGYPNDSSKEWTTNSEKESAWIKLTWNHPVETNQIELYDRPNPDDHLLAGNIEFDDGTTLEVEALPNDGKTPLTLTFPNKTIHWLKLTITKVAPETKNIGLSEMVVRRHP